MDDLLSAPSYERALLGLALTFPEAMADLAKRFRLTHFESRLHRVLWDAILRVYRRDGVAQVMTVAAALSPGDLEALGGIAGLCALAGDESGWPTPAAAEGLLKVLDDRLARRRFHAFLEKARAALWDPEQDGRLLTGRAKLALTELEKRSDAVVSDFTESWENVQLEAVPWIIKPWLPDEALTMFGGKEGEGKSLLSVKLCAMLSKGRDLLGRPLPIGPVRSIIVNAEDPRSVVAARLRANGAEPGMVRIFNVQEGGFEMTPIWQERLTLAIREHGAKLVVVDPIVRMGEELDFNSQTQVQKLLTPLTKIGQEERLAMMAIAHYNKQKDILGSVAFRTAVRSVIQVYKDPVHEDRAYVAHSKSNWGIRARSINFRIYSGASEEPEVEILGESARWTYAALKAAELDEYDMAPVKAAERFLKRLIAPYAMYSLDDLREAAKTETILFHQDHLRKAIFRLGLEEAQAPDESRGGVMRTFLRWPEQTVVE